MAWLRAKFGAYRPWRECLRPQGLGTIFSLSASLVGVHIHCAAGSYAFVPVLFGVVLMCAAWRSLGKDVGLFYFLL